MGFTHTTDIRELGEETESAAGKINREKKIGKKLQFNFRRRETHKLTNRR